MTAATTELDPFDSAPERGDFVRFKDLGRSCEDRLLIVMPLSKGRDKSQTAPYDMYDYVNAIVIPVDGPTDEKVPAVGVKAAIAPFEMRLSGAAIISGLLARLAENERKGRVGAPFLARMNWKPSKNNSDVKVWGFVPATQADNQMAREVLRAYEVAKSATEPDPFA